MKNYTYASIAGTVLLSAIVLNGCSDAVQKMIEDNKVEAQGVEATVMYSDGTPMGVTRVEEQVNGGFPIYHIGTGRVIGFIGADGVVNDKGGNDLGLCAGAVVHDTGLSGDCTIPVKNPYVTAEEPVQSGEPIVSQYQKPFPNNNQLDVPVSGCSTSGTSVPAPVRPGTPTTGYPDYPGLPGCEDRRDGTFDASWDQSTCQSHGYFYCTLNKVCTDQTVNINQCLNK